jgi:uncharacterized protein (TIGR03435 family)
MKPTLIVSITLFASWSVFCQSAATPSFEVASIRPDPDNRGLQQVEVSPRSLTIKKGSLSFMMQWAYNVRRDQIINPVGFKAESELYTVVARAAEPSPENQFRLMLQNLLAERYKLAFHRETKRLAVYEMVVAKGGPKLVESKLTETIYQRSGRTSYELPHTSMSELAKRLLELGAVSLPVVDRTAIPGFFDISLKFPDGMRPMDRLEIPVAANIFDIMEKQLGLKLEERKPAVEVLVIDHAERPTEN